MEDKKIMKKQENREKKASYKPLYCIFLVMVVLTLTQIQGVSAFEFDNVKNYDRQTKTVYIKNSVLGLKWWKLDQVAEMKLLTPQVNHVIRGKDRLVAEFEINNFDPYSNVFKDMEFYDIKKEMVKLDRQFTYKYEVITGTQEIPIYKDICEKQLQVNGSYIDVCYQEKKGTTIKEIKEWKILDEKAELPKGIIKVGIFTDVKAGDYVEWIPTLFGVRINEWAIWEESLNNGLVAYWNFENTTASQSTLTDNVGGVHNGTLNNMEDADWVSGKIGNALSFDGTNENVNIPDATVLRASSNFTIGCWFYTRENIANDNYIFSKRISDSDLDYEFQIYTGLQKTLFYTTSLQQISGNTLEGNKWEFGVWMYEDTGSINRTNFNGTDYVSGTTAGDMDTSTADLYIGARNGGSHLDGMIDECFYYNRTLTNLELENLWNNGDGITYATIDVDLNSPENNFNSSSQNISFNCSATDDIEVIDVNLYIDGSLNYTENTTGSNYLELLANFTLNEGDHEWTCNANDNDNVIWAISNYTFSVDTTEPSFALYEPIGNSTAPSFPTNITLNVTTTDEHLDTCWYSTNEDITNITYTCNALTNVSFSNDGSYTITYCANDTLSFENCSSVSYTIFDYNYTQSFVPSFIGEGGSVVFTLYVNMTNIPDTVANLTVNNTKYTDATKTEFTNYTVFVKTLAIPDGWGTLTGNPIDVYWNFSTEGITEDGTSIEQLTVYSIDLDDCSSYNETILNLTLRDEEGNSYINGTTVGSNVEIDLTLTGGTESWNYSNQWINNTNNMSVCIPDNLLNNTEYIIDWTIGFSAGNRVNEFHYLDNGTLDNSSVINSLTSKNVFLMDLLTVDSTSFLFNYFDEDGLVVADIIVHTFRKYIGEGLFREIERSKQNDDGDTIVRLVEEDVIYYFVISQNSTVLFTSNTYTALCQTTPCEIQLEESGGFQDFDSDWDLIDNGGYSLTSSSTTRVVNLTYALSSASTMNLTVYQLESDGSYDVVGSQQDTGTSGSLLVTVPTVSGNTSFFASVYEDGDFIKSEWVDFEEDAGLYFGNTLSLFLGALIILALGLMAVAEGSAVIIFLMLGMFIAMVLGLVDYRTSTGLNILIYFIIAGGIILWKITRRNR